MGWKYEVNNLSGPPVYFGDSLIKAIYYILKCKLRGSLYTKFEWRG